MKQIAKVSGIAYVMIFIFGFYANFAVLENLLNIKNLSITTANFINNHSQFGNGLLGFASMLLFDIVLVWSLFGITKSINKKISYVASFFRLLHALFFCIALFKLLEVYKLTYKSSNSKDLQNMVSELLSGFDTLWTIGIIFFGIHLIVLGYLTIKSTYIPKTLGVLLPLAGIGYLIDGIAKLFMSDYVEYKEVFDIMVIMPSVVGEFSLTVWLLIKGFKRQKSQKFVKVL